MAGIGTITKVLVAEQDMALGLGEVTQQRNNQPVVVRKMAIPLMYANIEAIKAVDPAKVPIAKLVGNSITEYYYDVSSELTPDDEVVLLPISGIGRWLKLGITADFTPTEVVEINNENTDATLSHLSHYLRFTFAGDMTYTLTEITSANGAEIQGKNDGTGNLTIVESGISVLTNRSLIVPPGGYFVLKHTEDENIWDMFGDTVDPNPESAFTEVIEINSLGVVADTSHLGKFLRFIYPGANTFTLAEITSENGIEIQGRNDSGDQLTIVEDGTTILFPTNGSLIIPTGGSFILKHSESGNQWLLSGDTVNPNPQSQFSEVIEIGNPDQSADISHVGKFLRFTNVVTEMNYWLSEVTSENGAEISGRNDSSNELFILEDGITISNPISGSKTVPIGSTFKLKHSEDANLWLMECYPASGGGGGGGVEYPGTYDYSFSATVNGINFDVRAWYLSSTAVHMFLSLNGTPSGGGGHTLKSDLPFELRSDLGQVQLWRQDFDSGVYANATLTGNGNGTSTLAVVMAGAPVAIGGSRYNVGIFPIEASGPA